jgi:hypothetical protein
MRLRVTQHKIEIPSQKEVERLRPYVNKVLRAIGIDQPHALKAWITDRSSVGDFYLVNMEEITSASISEEEFKVQIAMLSHRLDLEVSPKDLLIDVAKKLLTKSE